ncbi:hypothetical protein CROQUDRAFT_650572 [Cronartium quercuum f. sp. fusiforme G11]|uniref:Ig-like domain-containing protein n=1 Tax=Cronartium quercuum f. sp. fusiforme G11 TaxID=708437 RepID=A0A9P6NUR3_9BASI|nr:hypothetical protein CROQUDRAFT_650572 [Cronartium quercuum f. sp. fusiforme G11]
MRSPLRAFASVFLLINCLLWSTQPAAALECSYSMTDMTAVNDPGYTLCKTSSTDKGYKCKTISCSSVTLTSCHEGPSKPKRPESFLWYTTNQNPTRYVGYRVGSKTNCDGLVVQEAGLNTAPSAVCNVGSCEKK